MAAWFLELGKVLDYVRSGDLLAHTLDEEDMCYMSEMGGEGRRQFHREPSPLPFWFRVGCAGGKRMCHCIVCCDGYIT